MSYRRMKYTNSKGESIDFSSDAYTVQAPKGFGFEYEAVTTKTINSVLYRGLIEKERVISFDLKIRRKNLTQVYGLQANITKILLHDNLRVVTGTLEYTNAFRTSYIKAIPKTVEITEVEKGALTLKISFVCADPNFTNGEKKRFEMVPKNMEEFGHLYKHPYRHKSGSGKQSDLIYVSGTSKAKTKIYLYGPCKNPHVIFRQEDDIEELQVNISLVDGEFIEVDCTDKSMKLTKTNGSVENVLKHRNPMYKNFIDLKDGLYYIDFIANDGKVVIEYEERFATV
jgi:hypothetical protein